MIFLIEYQRSAGRIVQFQKFRDEERAVAERARVDRELARRADADYEVVLLEAESEQALRKTHGRYFFENDRVALAAPE